MKIHSIRFKNLNSLQGTWSIDLTHQAYVAETLFMISGPTGAGKTTLLDAVCLALYGKTPRLGTISKNTNEIMTRQTGECFAEVGFATSKGSFRSHWSQRRARRKPAGELQQPKHELSDASSNRIIQTGIRNVARAIEENTGMDFKQFTRAVLLAQGHFSEFLQASADERAPLLEQITGTELYSQISQMVHKLTTIEHTKAEELRRDADGISLLSDEQRQNLLNRLEFIKADVTDSQNDVLKKQLEKQWFENISSLEKEVAHISKDVDRATHNLERESPTIERLQLFQHLQPIIGDYKLLQNHRSQQKEEGKQLRLIKQQKQDLQTTLSSTRLAIKEQDIVVTKQEVQKEELQTLLKTVRKADNDIEHVSIQHQETSKQLREKKALLKKLELEAQNCQEALQKCRNHIEQHKGYFSSFASDNNLVEELGTIKTLFYAYEKQANHLSQLGEQLNGLRSELTTITDQLNAQKNKANEGSDTHARISDKLKKNQKEIEMLLGGEEISRLLNRQLALSEVKQTLSSWLELNDRLVILNKEIDRKTQLIKSLQSSITKIEQANQQLSEQRDLTHSLLEDLQTVLTQSDQMSVFADSRHMLEPGEPCPLCGSKTHVYGPENASVSETSDTRKRYETCRLEYEAMSKDLSEGKNKHALRLQELKYSSESLTEIEKKYGERKASLHNLERLLETEGERVFTPQHVGALFDDTAQQIKQITSKIKTLERLEQKTIILAKDEEKARKLLGSIDAAIQDLTTLQVKQHALVKQLEIDIARLEVEVKSAWKHLTELTDPYRQGEAFGAELIEILEKRFIVWKERKESLQELEEELRRLTLLQQSNYASQQEQRAEREIIKNNFSRLVKTLKALKEHRQDLFSDKNPEEEEQLLEGKIKTASLRLQKLKQKCKGSEEEDLILQERIRSLNDTLDIRKSTLADAESDFFNQLKSHNFDTEEAFNDALLPEAEFKQLTERIEKLQNQQQQFTALLRDKQQKLTFLQEKQLSSLSLEQVTSEISAINASISLKQQEIGRLSNTLETDEKQTLQHQMQIKLLKAQESKLEQWMQLHALIGSNDGKKFRNFAQGITFELLISNANIRLREMSDRYLLIHSSDRPLELNIIDAYQAGEVRSTKNLSGGESFIVSLALALGLSSMTSATTQIDSLFLDEGFGTLDEDALEIAIATLVGLRNQGKLVGIISHVASLKDRIPTQIEIIPGSGGINTIIGPGVCSDS